MESSCSGCLSDLLHKDKDNNWFLQNSERFFVKKYKAGWSLLAPTL
jgi:hypothetical protein